MQKSSPSVTQEKDLFDHIRMRRLKRKLTRDVASICWMGMVLLLLLDLYTDKLDPSEFTNKEQAPIPGTTREKYTYANDSLADTIADFDGVLKKHLSGRGLQRGKDSTIVPGKVKIPYPVYIASLYKSGTTTVHDYFVCGNQSAVHHGVARDMYFNIRKGVDPFEGFSQYQVFSDHSHFRGSMCFEPSTAMSLDAIYKFHPNMTMILSVRNSTSWVESVNKFYDLGSVIKNNCRSPGYFERWAKNQSISDHDLQALYEWQVAYVRQFAKNHPSITYIEIPLDDPRNGDILEARIGVPATCWGHSNKGHPRFSKQRGARKKQQR
jgi:hypothetical protein